MAGFGENLRKAREARKITLQDIAETTKIGTRALQALEDERFELLPGGIFNKGFVRAYARFVGLDEEKTVAAYMVAANVQPQEIDMQEMSSQVSNSRSGQARPGTSATTVMGVVALVVALGLGAVWLREHRKEAQGTAVEHPVVTAAAPVATAPTTVGAGEATQNTPQNITQTPVQNTTQNPIPNTAQSTAPNATQSASQGAIQSANQGTTVNATQKAGQGADAKQAVKPGESGAQGKPVLSATVKTGAAGKEQSPAPVRVSISAIERSWISVRSDGKTVESVTLDPDKPELRSRSYKAEEKLMLVVGNPRGVTVTYNGKPAGTLGVAGQRAIITFTPEGIEKQ